MKKAFSLSELLLALGIVAVISTLVITTVIPKGDEKKYATLANKAFLTLEEAYDVQIMNDAGQDASDYGPGNVLNRMISGDTPALPIYERNGNVAQLPNGMIINNAGSNLFVDMDGIEGKTRSTLNSPPNNCGEADILLFIINGSEISPNYNCGFAKEYFEYNDQIN